MTLIFYWFTAVLIIGLDSDLSVLTVWLVILGIMVWEYCWWVLGVVLQHGAHGWVSGDQQQHAVWTSSTDLFGNFYFYFHLVQVLASVPSFTTELLSV